MKYNDIRCEAVDVRTDSGIYPGVVKTEKGEELLIGARSPESKGICCEAFGAIGSMKLAMSLTDKIDWETKDYFDVVCPHGFVTFRLSRLQ